jgi:two-component system, OmpR family, response regulator
MLPLCYLCVQNLLPQKGCKFMVGIASPELHLPHVLIVDDEDAICKMLSRYLSRNGFRTSVASSGKGMMARLDQESYDLILLDLNLGAEDGLDLLRELNSRGRSRVIVVSGRKNPIDRVIGLELGADDYVCKPFHLREILARAKKALRPSNQPREAACDDSEFAFTFEGWKAIPGRRQLIAPNGTDIPLTGGEFKLLSVFLKNAGRVLSRQHLMDVIHGPGWHAYERTIDAQISRLRKKLEADPKKPKLLKSVHGDGYAFTASVSKPHARDA